MTKQNLGLQYCKNPQSPVCQQIAKNQFSTIRCARRKAGKHARRVSVHPFGDLGTHSVQHQSLLSSLRSWAQSKEHRRGPWEGPVEATSVWGAVTDLELVTRRACPLSTQVTEEPTIGTPL